MNKLFAIKLCFVYIPTSSVGWTQVTLPNTPRPEIRQNGSFYVGVNQMGASPLCPGQNGTTQIRYVPDTAIKLLSWILQIRGLTFVV